MSLRFDETMWLVLGIGIAIVTGVIGLRWFGAMAAVRRWAAVSVRFALVAVIVAMLAGATLRRESNRMAVIAVVDVSGSVRRFADFGAGSDRPLRGVEEAARRWLRTAIAGSETRNSPRGDDLLGVVLFDGQSSAIISPTHAPTALESPWQHVVAEDGSDLGGALRLAAGMLPPDARGRLVLFSDGNESLGAQRGGESGAQVAAELVAMHGGAPGRKQSAQRGWGGIDVVPIEYDVRNEVVLESVDAPPWAPGSTSITLRVVLRASGVARGTLQVLDEARVADINGSAPGTGRPIELAPGRHVELVEVRLNDSRIHRFEAVFEPESAGIANGSSQGASERFGDTVRENNRGRAFTLSSGRTSVLIVDGVGGGDPNGGGAVLANALRANSSAAGALAVEVVSPEAFTPDLLWLQTFDAIVLQNVPADALGTDAQEAISAYVREMAGGLVMVGGPDSFGPGGWRGTSIEPLLPVRLDLPEQLVTPGAAVVIVLDVSGSMSKSVMGTRLTQMEIAIEGAAQAIRTMDKTDMVGVIAFSDMTQVIVPLDRNRDPEASARRVGTISADGGTVIGPAMQLARAQLLGATADEKHVILLTDGRSTDPEQLPGLSAKMKSEGIRVSTIGIGDQADAATLSSMAQQGGGKFYRVIDPTLLPRVLVKAVRVIRTPMIRMQEFTPVLSNVGSPVIDEIERAIRQTSRSATPPLEALVLTRPRPEPGVTYAMVTPQGEPLLAYWNVGLGRVGAWTSDAHEWSSPWLGWEGYGRLWTQLVRMLARPAADRGLELRTEIDGSSLLVRLEASGSDGRSIEGLNVPVSVYAPDGRRIEASLEPIGSGTYEARVDAPLSGTYVVTAMPRAGRGDRGDAKPMSPVIAGVSRTEGDEYRRTKSNLANLQLIAAAGGGRLLGWANPQEAALFDRGGITPAEARLPLWRTLLWAALALMLLDVATRRIAWDRFVSREFGAELKRGVEATTRDRGSAAMTMVGRLIARDTQAEDLARADQVQRPVSLGEQDALEIVRRERERRRETRHAASQEQPGPSQPRPGPGDGQPGTPPELQGDPHRGGLFAAKQRARERLRKDEQQ